MKARAAYVSHVTDASSSHTYLLGICERDGLSALETCVKRIAEIHHQARADGDESRPEWPMIILRTPKGWTTASAS